MKEYRMAKVWAWVIYIISPPMIALFTYLPFGLYFEDQVAKSGILFFILPMSLGMIALFVLAILDVRINRVVFADDKVDYYSIFGNKTIYFDEIKGYRLDDKYIYIEPISIHHKRIKFGRYWGKTNELIEWLDNNYFNLDFLDLQEAELVILKDPTLGNTTGERAEKLRKARFKAKVLNWTAGFIALWAICWPAPYEYDYAMLSCMAMAVFTLFASRFLDPLLRIGLNQRTAYPSIILGLLAPSAALLRVMFDYDMYDYSLLWTPVLLLTGFLTTLLFMTNKDFTFKTVNDFWKSLGYGCIMMAYSYGSLLFLNCYYDTIAPKSYTVSVTGKRIIEGKSNTYYIQLAPWATRKDTEDVSVPQQLYKAVEVHEKIKIDLHPGKLNLPWFVVQQVTSSESNRNDTSNFHFTQETGKIAGCSLQ